MTLNQLFLNLTNWYICSYRDGVANTMSTCIKIRAVWHQLVISLTGRTFLDMRTTEQADSQWTMPMSLTLQGICKTPTKSRMPRGTKTKLTKQPPSIQLARKLRVRMRTVTILWCEVWMQMSPMLREPQMHGLVDSMATQLRVLIEIVMLDGVKRMFHLLRKALLTLQGQLDPLLVTPPGYTRAYSLALTIPGILSALSMSATQIHSLVDHLL